MAEEVTDLGQRKNLFNELKNSEKRFARIIEQNTEAWKEREEKMFQRGRAGEPSNDIFTGFYKWAAKKQPGIFEEATRRAYRKSGFINTAVFAKEVRKLTIENTMKGPIGKIVRLYTDNRFARAFGADFAKRFSATPLGKGFNTIASVLFKGRKKKEQEDPYLYVKNTNNILETIQKDIETIKNLIIDWGKPKKLSSDNSKKTQELMVYPLDKLLENSNKQLELTNGNDIAANIALRNSEERADKLIDAVIDSGQEIEDALKKAKDITDSEKKKGGFLGSIMNMFKGLSGLLAPLAVLLAPIAATLAGLGASLLGAIGPALGIALAGAAGYAIGTWLDKKFGISDAISRAISGGNVQDRLSEMAAQKQEANLAGLKISKKAISNIEGAGGTKEEQIAELEKRKQLALDMARQKQREGDGSDENMSNVRKITKVAEELQKEINKLKGATVEGAPSTTGSEMNALASDNANKAAGAVIPVTMQGGNSSSANTNNVTTVVQNKSLNRSDLAAYGMMRGVHAW